MVESVPHDELRAHVLEELPRGADIFRRNIEMMNVGAAQDKHGGNGCLADTRLAADQQVARGKLPSRQRLLDAIEDELAPHEVFRAFVDERAELGRPDEG